MKPSRDVTGKLPLLVADLADEHALARLLAIARGGGTAWVTLVAPPVAGGPHVLELYRPGSPEPVRLRAEVVGEGGPRGFPLRLAVPQEDAAAKSPGVAAVAPSGAAPSIARAATGAPARVQLEGRALSGGALTVGGLLERAPTHALHRGLHRELSGPVVVRVMDETFRDDASFSRRFLDEATAATSLAHPNLSRVLACGREDDGLLWVASEQPDGQTLRERLGVEGPMPTTRLVPLVQQICEGLRAVHEAGLVHRDVRPDNVVLSVTIDASVRPKVVAKVREIGFGLGSRLASGRVAVGAPEYMSPEQCRGEGLDPRSDVYALGVLLYELVTGEVPFASDRPIVVVNRHLSMIPPRPSERQEGVDPRLDALVMRALEKAPAGRHASIRELEDELVALLRPAPRVSAPPPAPPEPRPLVPLASTPPPPLTSEPAAPMPAVTEPPPPVSVSPPLPARAAADARASRAPEWLEEAGSGYARFFEGMATGAPHQDGLVDALSKDPVSWLAKLARERDPRAFASLLRELEPATRELAASGDARAVWAVSSALHGIATEETQGPGSRSARAAAMLRMFSEPSILAPIAERRLAASDEPAHTLLVRAGAMGAHALYGARVKLADRPEARAPFVATLRAIGAAGWPVTKAALERMPETALEGRHPRGAELAEDLLVSVPALRDDAAAQVCARYMRARVPALAAAAARGLARIWSERASPYLVALLDDPLEGVRAAAISGLREIGAVDADVVARLAPLVRREVPATPALRLSAIAALGAVVEEARPLAVPLLVGTVRSAPRGEERFVHAAAGALLSMLGNQARAVVLDRMDRSEEPLRSALGALLANPTLALAEPR